MIKNPSIRIFVDAHVFDGEFQGTRTFIKGLYNELAKKKDLQLFIAARNTDNLKINFPNEGNIIFIRYRSRSSLKRLVFEIPALIKKYNIDFAHFQYISPPIKSCKFIVTTHDIIFSEYPDEFPFLYRAYRKWLFKRSVKKADIVTTVSEYSKNSIAKYLKTKPDIIHVIPNGVNEKYFESYDKQNSVSYIRNKYGFEKFILFVSRIEPRKNHILLLKVFLELKLYLKDLHLVFLGRESLSVPQLNRMIANLPDNIKPYVFMNSEVGDSDLLEFYRAASIFVYPSKAEGFGIPPLEAAALKIPVICSNTSAMHEFAFFELNRINPYDSDQVKNTLFSILQDPPDKYVLNQISRVIQEKYSWSNSAHQLYQLIKRD